MGLCGKVKQRMGHELRLQKSASPPQDDFKENPESIEAVNMILLVYMDGCFACMDVCVSCVSLVPLEATRGSWSPGIKVTLVVSHHARARNRPCVL